MAEKEESMPRVIHFELPVDDPERASQFYSDAFGWKLTKWDGPQEYWLVATGEQGPGIDGGLLQRRPGLRTTVNTIDVPDLDEYTARIESLGGRVVVPKQEVQGVGLLAYCQDTEGNLFGILQPSSG